jgi:hypothetical protein
MVPQLQECTRLKRRQLLGWLQCFQWIPVLVLQVYFEPQGVQHSLVEHLRLQVDILYQSKQLCSRLLYNHKAWNKTRCDLLPQSNWSSEGFTTPLKSPHTMVSMPFSFASWISFFFFFFCPLGYFLEVPFPLFVSACWDVALYHWKVDP